MLVLGLVSWQALGCSQHARSQEEQEQPPLWSLNTSTGEVAGVIPGVPLLDVRHLGFCQKSEMVQMEGDEYEQVTLYLGQSTMLRLLADLDGTLYRISTEANTVKDERGLGVGSSVEDLIAAYPSGRLYFLLEEGAPQVKYINGSKVSFVFDPSRLSTQCFIPGEICEPPEDLYVTGLEIHAIELKLD